MTTPDFDEIARLGTSADELTQPINTPDPGRPVNVGSGGRARTDQPAELDPGMVEKARAAFEAMTKAMLDAGRRYEERMNAATTAALSAANVPGLVAEVERLRYDLDHSYSQREWSALTARATSAEQERDRLRAGWCPCVDGRPQGCNPEDWPTSNRHGYPVRLRDAVQQAADLRAGIEGLAGDPTAQDKTGTWIDRKRVADLLAGSGEQPGCICRPTHRVDDPICQYRPAPVVHNHGTEDGPGLACPETRLPDGSLRGACVAPVVPDSPDAWERVRAALASAVVDSEPVNAYASRPLTFGESASETLLDDLTDAVLAVVGQGVTAEEDRDGLLPIEREVADFLWQKWRDPDNPAVLIHEDPRTVARHLRPYLRAAVRPTGQEQADG